MGRGGVNKDNQLVETHSLTRALTPVTLLRDSFFFLGFCFSASLTHLSADVQRRQRGGDAARRRRETGRHVCGAQEGRGLVSRHPLGETVRTERCFSTGE